jgi:hypothetical protein
MKIKLLTKLSIFLEWACQFVHWVPYIGCTLSTWSYSLDQKYNLGVWVMNSPNEDKQDE